MEIVWENAYQKQKKDVFVFCLPNVTCLNTRKNEKQSKFSLSELLYCF